MCNTHRHLGSDEAPRTVQVPKRAAAERKKIEAPVRAALVDKGPKESKAIEAKATVVIDKVELMALHTKMGELSRLSLNYTQDVKLQGTLTTLNETLRVADRENDSTKVAEAKILIKTAETRLVDLNNFKKILDAVRASFTAFRENNAAFMTDREVSKALQSGKELLDDCFGPENNDELMEAEVNLRRANTRVAALKAANVSPDSQDEKLARIAKERAIRGALNGAVNTAKIMSGKDFNTVVRPWRDGLTKGLAKACGMQVPSDKDLGNPGTRTALLIRIKEDVVKTIGQAEATRLLPHFIQNVR